MNDFIQKLISSKFMQSLQTVAGKMQSHPVISSISEGMSKNLGIILAGAIFQIVASVGDLIFNWGPDSTIFQMLNYPYKYTMGLIALFMVFSIASTYGNRLQLNPQSSAFTALVSFLIVAVPIRSITEGETLTEVMEVSGFGATGIFVAIIVAIISVQITNFIIEKNWTVSLPESVPEGVTNSFTSIIPILANIVLWYGINILVTQLTNEVFTLSSLITYVLSIPMNYLLSVPGMIIILILAQIFWFFGIHGTSVILIVILPSLIAAYATNAELYAQGLPLEFHPVFLFGANGLLAGAGNTLPLMIMGLRSKSEKIKAISTASLIPNIFNINEPVIFGYPMMYNPIMFIPFVFSPAIIAVLLYFAYTTGLIGLPHTLIFAVLPVGLGTYLATLDWRNILFVILMYPIVHLIYYPFYKIYEKQSIEEQLEVTRKEATRI